MKIFRYAAVIVFAVALSASLEAQRPGEQEQVNLDRANASLDELYQRLMRALPAEDQKALKDAERAWIAWRDQEANLRARLETEGGSARRVAFLEASIELVQERQKLLEEYRKKLAR